MIQIDGFNTFRHEDGFEQLVTRVHVERDEETGNYYVELFGKDADGIDGEFIIDAEEKINFQEVMIYLKYLGRDHKYMMGQLQKFGKEIA